MKLLRFIATVFLIVFGGQLMAFSNTQPKPKRAKVELKIVELQNQLELKLIVVGLMKIGLMMIEVMI